MNLQQLNGNGKTIKGFLLIAAILPIVTGGSWWLVEQWNALATWCQRKYHNYKGPVTKKKYGVLAPDYSISVRVAMLRWLIRHGHWSWMVDSGAGWCILINSRTGFKLKITSSEVWLLQLRGQFAGDYVSKFSGRSSSVCRAYDDRDPFKLTMGWWTAHFARIRSFGET